MLGASVLPRLLARS